MVQDGIDEGSTYMNLECSCCKTIIGKTYKSTTSVTDQFRNTFSFDMDKIKTYVLGSYLQPKKDNNNVSESNNETTELSCRVKFNPLII